MKRIILIFTLALISSAHAQDSAKEMWIPIMEMDCENPHIAWVENGNCYVHLFEEGQFKAIKKTDQHSSEIVFDSDGAYHISIKGFIRGYTISCAFQSTSGHKRFCDQTEFLPVTARFLKLRPNARFLTLTLLL